MHQKNFIVIVGLLIGFARTANCQNHKDTPLKNPIMVVYIHGTHITPGLVKRWLGSEVKSEDIARIENQSSSAPTLGLTPIKREKDTTMVESLPPKTTLFAQSLNLVAPMTEQFKERVFYSYQFNWDGKLSKQSRSLWAERLYSDLTREKERLVALLQKPIDIYIVAHSHGATVAAQLSVVEQIEKKNLTITKLVNLGAPILKETLVWLSSPVFERVYHFYSDKDYVQVVGALSSKGIGISREFRGTKTHPLPSNLIQVKVGVDATGPYHQEFWITGISPIFYRSYLSIYPLPIACLVPLFLDILSRFPSSPPHFSLTLSRKNDRYFIKTYSVARHSLGLYSFPFSPAWKDYLEKQTELTEPLTLLIRKKMHKLLFIGGIVVGAALLKKYYSSAKGTDEPQPEHP